MITALLNLLGRVLDVDREKFTMLVIKGNSTGRYCFKVQVGNGSDTQDFEDNNLISFSTSSSEPGSNSNKSDSGKEETTEETIEDGRSALQERLLRIAEIFSIKKPANLSGSSSGGRLGSLDSVL